MADAARTLTDADVEAIADALERRLRKVAAAEPEPAAPVIVTERHMKIAADRMARPRKIRMR